MSTAKFVKFTSVHQPDVMLNDMLQWPYVEGLRIDEAVHPLTILAVGMYGEKLPKAKRCASAAGRALEIWL